MESYTLFRSGTVQLWKVIYSPDKYVQEVFQETVSKYVNHNRIENLPNKGDQWKHVNSSCEPGLKRNFHLFELVCYHKLTDVVYEEIKNSRSVGRRKNFPYLLRDKKIAAVWKQIKTIIKTIVVVPWEMKISHCMARNEKLL